ncbi:MAG: bacterial transcriptional activator domain-containing protein, partial [Clostridia bacterium]|nr:bacterial transcriptional activator domain-containing protein [Clostridia bacterium]
MESLLVRLMSAFELRYGGEPIRIAVEKDTGAARLLPALLFYEEKGVPLQEISEIMHGEQEDGRAVSVSEEIETLRTAIARSGLPAGEYVYCRDGAYRFGGPVKIESDAAAFLDACRRAEECEEDDLPLCLDRACALYDGELLPSFSAQSWVVYQNAVLVNKYTDMLRQLCLHYTRTQEYERLCVLCSRAAHFFPFDEEWHALRINSMLAQGKYRQALDVYEEVRALLFDELGVFPSEKLMECARAIGERVIFPAP